MENNENNVQNQVNEAVNKPQKSGKKVTIILGIIVLILVLVLGVCAGLLISGNGNKIIKQVEEKIVNNEEEKEIEINEKKSSDNDVDKVSYFEQNKNLNYSSNPKDNINGKVAIIKMGEKIFQTEKHDGYYTYIDNFGNSYNIKEITNITSEHRLTSNDYKTNLFRAVIEYIDNNDAKKSFDTAVFVPNDANNYSTLGINGPYENYTGSTSFVKAFTDLYDDGSSNTDYSIFNSYKGRTYKNEDFNTTPEVRKEYCELKFDDKGKPTVKIGYKSDNNTECYFQTKDISNLKSEGAAGTTYVTFDFTAWTPGGDTTGNATISFSNVSEDYTMTVSAKANFDIGTREYNNIEVRAVGQNAVENFVLPELKNRIYEGQENLTGLWYKLEFDENGKPTITITSSEGENKQIVDKYTRFTDVHSDGAAGTMYINFSYRLMNETGNKVEGYLGYSNNTDNNEIRLKMDNMESEIMVKRIK